MLLASLESSTLMQMCQNSLGLLGSHAIVSLPGPESSCYAARVCWREGKAMRFIGALLRGIIGVAVLGAAWWGGAAAQWLPRISFRGPSKWPIRLATSS